MKHSNSFFFKKQKQFLKIENYAWRLFFSEIESPFLFKIVNGVLACALTLIALVFLTNLTGHLLIGIHKSTIITVKCISIFVSKSCRFYRKLKKNIKLSFKRFKRNVKGFLRKKRLKKFNSTFKNSL